jgi:hypothetical protein
MIARARPLIERPLVKHAIAIVVAALLAAAVTYVLNKVGI